jgi:hypothetical protein
MSTKAHKFFGQKASKDQKAYKGAANTWEHSLELFYLNYSLSNMHKYDIFWQNPEGMSYKDLILRTAIYCN